MWNLNNQGKRIIHFGILLSLSLLLFALGTKPLQAQTSFWQATYWNNRDMIGIPVLERQEAELNHNWGTGSPHPLVNADEFSVQWLRNMQMPTGTYRFTADADDGMRVWIDDVLIIDTWYNGQVHFISADIFLLDGAHQIRVEYYEAGGQAIAQLDSQLLSTPEGDWLAQYYDNTTLSGEPALVRYEPQINLDSSDSPAPGLIGQDRFSVSWTQDLTLDAGRYHFTVTVDDGVRLWVNDQLIIDEWYAQSAATFSAEIDVPGGQIPVRLAYYENTGVAVAYLDWMQLTAVPSPPVPPVDTWRGEYYNNVSLAGAPVLVREDAQINFDWGMGSPAPGFISGERFSIRWSRTLNLNPGRYEFTTRTDDGTRLWVDGFLLIDAWQVQIPTSYSVLYDHPGGPLPVTMEYFENTGLAETHLFWTQISFATSDGDAPTATMAGTNHLNVRSGPGLTFAPFTYLTNGQTVPMIGRDQLGLWIKIRLPDGHIGWVSSRYLISDTPVADLPIVN